MDLTYVYILLDKMKQAVLLSYETKLHQNDWRWFQPSFAAG
jgi:hypothetical protein